MSAIKNTLATGVSALLLAFSLVACGTNDATTEDQDAATKPAAATLGTDAEVDPDAINPGWLYGDNTSDLWYAQGDADAEALYFTNAANDAGMDVTFVSADDTEDNVWDLQVADGHLLTRADAADKRAVDITFQDNFTCYDAETKTHYVRGDRTAAQYGALIAGKVFVEDVDDPDDFMVTFGDDGTVTQSMGDDAIEGTWEVQTPNVVVARYDNWDTEYRWDPDSAEIVQLDDGSASPLLVYNE